MAVYHTAKTGSDSNSCTQALNPATPKLTIAAGRACLAGGDTLLIGDGIYTEAAFTTNSIPNGLGPTQHTTIMADTFRGATIRATSSAHCVADISGGMLPFRGTQREYITIRDLVLDGGFICAYSALIFVSTGTTPSGHLHFIGNKFGRFRGNSNGVGLFTAGWSAGTASSAPHDILVRGNEIHDFDPVGLHFGNHCFYVKTRDSIYEDNHIHDCQSAGASGTGINGMHGSGWTNHGESGTSNNVIRRNLIRRTGGPCVRLSNGPNNVAYNNICVTAGMAANLGSSPDAALVITLNGVLQNKFWNNTVYDHRNPARECIRVVNADGHEIRNNICYGGVNTTADTMSTGGSTTSNNRCASGCTTSANPLFVNAALGDFRLTASSPMIGAGIAVASVTTDYLGLTRPNPPSIGAHEFAAVEPDPGTDDVVLVTQGSSGVAGSTYTTGSLMLEPSTVYLLGVYGISAGTTAVPSIVGWETEWTTQADIIFSGSAHRLTVFRTLTPPDLEAPDPNPLELGFATGQLGVMWALFEVGNVNTGGLNGAHAVLQAPAVKADSATTFITVPMVAFADTANMALAFFATGGVRSASVPSDYVTISTDTQLVAPATGTLVVLFKDSMATLVHPEVTWSANALPAAIALELNTGASPAAPIGTLGLMMDAGLHGGFDD